MSIDIANVTRKFGVSEFKVPNIKFLNWEIENFLFCLLKLSISNSLVSKIFIKNILSIILCVDLESCFAKLNDLSV